MRPQPAERRQVLGRAIPLVTGKTVARRALVQSNHGAVAADFSQDGGCGDTEALPVAAHDRPLRQLAADEPQRAVDQDPLRLSLIHI